jgi:endonuclease YncB( thermonuclease family)
MKIIWTMLLLWQMVDEPKQNFTGELSLPAKIVEVHDGDTVTVEFKIQANIRLIDCWSPELGTKEGEAAKEFLSKILKKDSEVLVKAPFNGKINKSFSLTRLLARVYRDTDGDGIPEDMSQLMIKWGFATEKKPKKGL